MSKLYDFSDYDKHMALKIEVKLWLIIAYLMRPFIALISSFQMGPGSGTSGVDRFRLMLYPDDFSLTLGIFSALPVLLVLFAYVRRKPDSGVLIHTVWYMGAWLLSLSAVLNIVIVFFPLLTGMTSRIHVAGWVQVGLAVSILLYLFGSRRVRDTFADFPRADG